MPSLPPTLRLPIRVHYLVRPLVQSVSPSQNTASVCLRQLISEIPQNYEGSSLSVSDICARMVGDLLPWVYSGTSFCISPLLDQRGSFRMRVKYCSNIRDSFLSALAFAARDTSWRHKPHFFWSLECPSFMRIIPLDVLARTRYCHNGLPKGTQKTRNPTGNRGYGINLWGPISVTMDLYSAVIALRSATGRFGSLTPRLQSFDLLHVFHQLGTPPAMGCLKVPPAPRVILI